MKCVYIIKLFFLFILFSLMQTVFLFAQSEGETLFRLNKPEAAIPVLEKEL